MKVLLIRFGVLGSLVVLGWITIANAQRGNERPNPLRELGAAGRNFPRRIDAAVIPAHNRAAHATTDHAAGRRLDSRRLGDRAVAAVQSGGAVAVFVADRLGLGGATVGRPGACSRRLESTDEQSLCGSTGRAQWRGQR